jgi:hypothetical protein
MAGWVEGEKTGKKILEVANNLRQSFKDSTNQLKKELLAEK